MSLRGCWSTVLCLGFAVVASGQEPPAARPFREAATVPADSTVAKSLGQVEEFVAAGRWEDALEILQQLTETHSATLIQVQPGAAGGVAWYANVATRASILLSQLPKSALMSYRARLDPLARDWFAEWTASRREEELQHILRVAFLSSYGDDALLALGEAAWDRGDFATARKYWTQLIPLPESALDDRFPGVLRYPDSDLEIADIRARLVLCSAMLGQGDRARRELSQFSTEFPDAEGMLGGRSGRLRVLLEELLQERENETRREIHGAGFPTFAGSAARQKLVADLPELATPKWSAPLRENRMVLWQRRVLQRDNGPLASYPVIWKDLVLTADEGSISAWNLLTGRPAWSVENATRAEIYPAVPEDRASPPDRPALGLPRYTLTVDAGRMYARMGWPVTSASRRELRNITSSLVCLDLEHGEGQLQWLVAAEDLPAGDGPLWNWEGTPVVAQGQVYAVACRRRPQLELAVVCLDPASGQVEWLRPVCTSRPQAEEDFNRVTHLLLSAAEGRLFLSTDAGAIIALDAGDGRLDWAVTYEPLQEPGGLRPAPPRFGLLPCVVHNGRVYAAPNDSDRMYCIEAATGRLIWSRATPERVTSILGVGRGFEGDLLILSGRSLWAHETSNGKLAWRCETGSTGYGQGVLSEEQIVFPTRESLVVVDQASGVPRREYPLQNPDAAGTGGNLAVVPGWIVVAEPTRVVAYWEFSGPRRQMLDRLSLEPYDHAARLRLAEYEAARGEESAAIAEWKLLQEFARRHEQPEVREQAEMAWGRWACCWSQTLLKAGQTERAEQTLRETLDAVSEPAARSALWLELARVAAPGDPLEPLVQVLEEQPDGPAAIVARRLLRRLLESGDAALQERYAHARDAALPFQAGTVQAALSRAQALTQRQAILAARSELRVMSEWPVAEELRTEAQRTVEQLTAQTRSEAALIAGPPAPWWQQTWERTLLPGQRVAFPECSPGSAGPDCLLVLDHSVTAIDTGTGGRRWSRRAGEPVRRSLSTDAELVLVCQHTLEVLDSRTGELLWELAVDTQSGELQVRGDQLVWRRENGEFIAYRLRNGESLWQTQVPEGRLQSQWGLGEGRLWCQTLGPDRTWSCRLADGEWEPSRAGVAQPWRGPPVVSTDLTLGMLAGPEQRPCWIGSDAEQSVVPFQGALSHAHSSPELRTDQGRWWVIVDGLSLSGVEPVTGLISGSVALSSRPVRTEEQDRAWGRHRVWSACDGTLRGISLTNPADVCTVPLGDQRCWSVQCISGALDSIWVWPAERGKFELVIVSDQTGVVRQRIPQSEPAQVRATAQGPVVIGERSLRGYAPLTARALADRQ